MHGFSDLKKYIMLDAFYSCYCASCSPVAFYGNAGYTQNSYKSFGLVVVLTTF